MRFLDVKTDYAFKRVFGAEGSKPILIEMQVLNVPGFEKRILHNAAKQYATQLQRGDDYRLLNPVIAITFTDFTLFDDSPEHLSRFRLIERERFIEYSDDVELIFIELPKFNFDLEQLQTIQDKWVYFVKNAGRLEYIPDSLGNDPCIHAAFDQINEAAMTLEELEMQHKRRDFIILQRGSLELAEAKGWAEGEHQTKLAIARNLLDVLDDATISAKTGLTVGEIRHASDFRRGVAGAGVD